jgi:hypothetical protein
MAEIRSIEPFPIQQKPNPDGTTTYSNLRLNNNMMAYVDASGQFKVFYHGVVTTLESYEPVMYMVDKDIVIYIDNSNNFKFFSKGQSYETDAQQYPQILVRGRFLYLLHHTA